MVYKHTALVTCLSRLLVVCFVGRNGFVSVGLAGDLGRHLTTKDSRLEVFCEEF
jgi:hypothetical protein